MTPSKKEYLENLAPWCKKAFGKKIMFKYVLLWKCRLLIEAKYFIVNENQHVHRLLEYMFIVQYPNQ